MRSRGEDVGGGSAAWIVLRHSSIEGLGLLGTVLRDLGIQHRSLDASRGEPLPKEVPGGLIVLGGNASLCGDGVPPYVTAECELVERAITNGRPVLGICLGAQMVAQVLGARVYKGERPEVGWGTVALTEDANDDPLFLDQPAALNVFHMHGDTYELPADARQLARSDAYEQQAFSWGSVVYGMQFHLEFTESIVERLVADPESHAYIEKAGTDPAALAAAAADRVAAMTSVAQDVFERYFQHCGV